MPDTQGSRNHASNIYLEVTIPGANGEPVQFYTEEHTTEELDLRKLHDFLVKSESVVAEKLGIRRKF
jgi:hypothetical protein